MVITPCITIRENIVRSRRCEGFDEGELIEDL
jgi:hypothetical protein